MPKRTKRCKETQATYNAIPQFKNADEEHAFWATHDSTDYIDWSKAKRTMFPNLKATSRSIPIRFPISLLEHIKVLAHKSDVPYQSLIKTFLTERVAKELRRAS